MNKLKILGIGNEGGFSYLIIEKNKFFFELMEKWIKKSFPKEYLFEFSTHDGKKKNIKNYEDKHEYYYVKGTRLDAFFGKNKIFLTMHTSLGNKKNLMNTFGDFAYFIKPPKNINKKKRKTRKLKIRA